MELLRALAPLLALIVGAVVVCVVIRLLRDIYVAKVTLSSEEIRDLQSKLVEEARVASIQPGMEIDINPFFKGSGLHEPDRRAVIHPLVDSRIFGWRDQSGGGWVDVILDRLRWVVWRPTRTRIVLSQWVRDEVASGNAPAVVIQGVLGDVVMGAKAGRDVIGGDQVGRDKVDGDDVGAGAQVIRGGRDVSRSGNAYSAFGDQAITTAHELSSVLQHLANDVRNGGDQDQASVAEALEWAAAAAEGRVNAEPHTMSRMQRRLDRADGPVRGALTAIVQGVTGALTEHWLLDVLRGS